MPVTRVKDPAQATRLGVPLGSVAPIIVPPGQDPQGMINQWTEPNLKTSIDFYNTWKPGGPNDYKLINPIYDAYGNFEYGATGAANGYFDFQLQGVGNGASLLEHRTLNNPINRQDIQSGANAVNNGGVIITVPVHYP